MNVKANLQNIGILDTLKPEKLSQSHFYFWFQMFSKKMTWNFLEIL